MQKITMAKRLSTILISAAVLAAVAPNTARADADDLQRTVDQGFPEVTPLPQPIDALSDSEPCATATPFQLVGFTRANLDGTQGGLNYTLACQQEFPSSRMCTTDEVRETVSVPKVPGFGYAWVGENPARSDAANCRGWVSSATSDSGTAIDLAGQYGAKVLRNCNQPLRIACCAAQSVSANSSYRPKPVASRVR